MPMLNVHKSTDIIMDLEWKERAQRRSVAAFEEASAGACVSERRVELTLKTSISRHGAYNGTFCFLFVNIWFLLRNRIFEKNYAYFLIRKEYRNCTAPAAAGSIFRCDFAYVLRQAAGSDGKQGWWLLLFSCLCSGANERCKHDHPKDEQASATADVVCRGVAAERGLCISGRRSALG